MAQSSRKRAHSSGSLGGSGDDDLQNLITSLNHTPPGHINSVFQRIENVLANLSNDENRFIQAIDTILTNAYTADRKSQSAIAQLLRKVSEIKVMTRTGGNLSVYQLVSKTCLTLPSMSEASLKEFLSALPFLEDLHRFELFSRRPFLFFAEFFLKRQGGLPPAAIVCLYEIVRTVDRLIDDRLYGMNKNEEKFWISCAGRVGNSCRQGLFDEASSTEILRVLHNIKEKGWIRKSSQQNERPRKPAPAERPLRPLLKNKSNNTGDNRIIEKSSMTSAFQFLLAHLRITVSVLAKWPQNVELVAREIRRSFDNVKYLEAKFKDTIYALLTIASEASPMELPVYARLLINLDKFCEDLRNGKGRPLRVRIFVSAWAMQLRRFEKNTDVLKFCKVLPLINSLYMQKMLISGVFRYYAAEVANKEDEVSMLALYEILQNVDKLAEAKVWKYKEDEAAFYEECCCSLAMACQTNTIKDANKAREITSFLAAIPQKGGWHRASIARYLKKSQNKMQSAGTSQIPILPETPQVNEEMETDGEDDESVILIATSFPPTPNNNDETAIDEGFEEKPHLTMTTEEEEEQEKPEPEQEHDKPEQEQEPEIMSKNLVEMAPPISNGGDQEVEVAVSEEKIETIFNLLKNTPESWPNLAAEMENYLRSFKTKNSLNNAANEIWKEIAVAEPEILPVYVHLLDVIQSVTVTTGKGREYSLRKAFTKCAQEGRKCKKMKHLVEFCLTLRVTNELFRVNLVERSVFRNFVEVIEQEVANKVVKSIFIYETLRTIDGLIDARVWKFESDEEREFWAKISRHLSKACRKYLAGHDRVEEISKFLEEVEKKGGWFRKVKSKKNKTQEEPIPEVNHANFCTFLETNFLKETAGIMTAVRFFKSMLLSLSSPCLLTEAVELILDRIFEINDDRTTVESAVKLCAELCQVKNEGGKGFIATLQEVCVKLFSQKARQDAEDSLIKLQNEIEATASPQEQMILVEKMERLAGTIKCKYAGCARLIARLFTEKLVQFNFFLSFVDCLISIRSDDMIEALLEVLSIAGKDFEDQTRVVNCMEMWWSNFFNELTQIGQQFDSSPRKKSIVSEILLLKTNGWPNLTLEQLAAKRLKFMLLELTPALMRNSLKYSATLDRVRSFFRQCPPEFGGALMEVMFCEFQNCLSDLSQTQQQFQQQGQQIAFMMSCHQYPPATTGSPWFAPPMTVYSNNTSDNTVVKTQQNLISGEGSATTAARVVSLTSLPYPPNTC